MTSEAHKRNPPGSERWGNATKLRLITDEQASMFAENPLSAPAVLEYEGKFYCLATEYTAWVNGNVI